MHISAHINTHMHVSGYVFLLCRAERTMNDGLKDVYSPSTRFKMSRFKRVTDDHIKPPDMTNDIPVRNR